MVKMDSGDRLLLNSLSKGIVLPFECRSAEKSQICWPIGHPRTEDDKVDTIKGVCSETG